MLRKFAHRTSGCETPEEEKLLEMLNDVRRKNLQMIFDGTLIMYIPGMLVLLFVASSDTQRRNVEGCKVLLTHLLIYSMLLLRKFGPGSVGVSIKVQASSSSGG